MSQPISKPLRIWFGVEVLFGILAVIAVGLRPSSTATNFAWAIKPVVMAASLGAFYIASAPLFLLPMLAKRWEMVRVMTLPVALFSTIQLMVTFLHWDKFHVHSGPFYVWFASYVLPQPIFVGAYLWHQRRRDDTADPQPLGRALRAMLLGLGVGFTGIALLVLISPGVVTGRFAWKMSPLTARSLSGWLMVVGALQLSIVHENHRARSRLASPFLIVAFPAMLLQLVRYRDQVRWGNTLLWVGLALLLAACGCGTNLGRGSWNESLRE
jgi:hypothetical protein